MGKPDLKDFDSVLLVEGYSDLHFSAELLELIGRKVYIKEFKGKRDLLKFEALHAFLNPQILAEKKCIGILVDADENPQGTSQSAQHVLQKVTGRDLTEGVWQEGQPKLGYFVVPDPTTPGELETLVWNAMPNEPDFQSMKSAVGSYLRSMEQTRSGWKPHSPDKGSLGTFLACVSDEDPRLGPATRDNKIDLTWPGFDRLREFFCGFPEASAEIASNR